MSGNMQRTQHRKGEAEVTYDDLLELSGVLSNKWMDVGRYLGVPEPKLQELKGKNKNRKEDIMEMLLEWKEIKGTTAIYAALSSALMNAGRTDLAQYYMPGKRTHQQTGKDVPEIPVVTS